MLITLKLKSIRKSKWSRPNIIQCISQFTNLSIGAVILLSTPNNVTIIMTMEDKILLKHLRKPLKITIVRKKGYLINKDQTITHIISTKLIPLIQTTSIHRKISVNENADTTPQIMISNGSKKCTFTRAGQAEITCYHLNTSKKG